MAQKPRLITHPSHPNHSLTLLPTAAYPNGLFKCNGCGHQGLGSCYHCSRCNFDLHVLCAFKPLSLTHQSHNHQLKLTFGSPYHPKGYICNICRKNHICYKTVCDHWVYHCDACRFDAHLECVTNKPKPLMAQPEPQISHYNSLPGAYNIQHNRNNRQPAGGMNYHVHSKSVDKAPTTGTIESGGNALMDTVVKGIVESAAQQIGQSVVRSIINDGNDGGGGGDDDDDELLSSLISIGSSILSGMFGNA